MFESRYSIIQRHMLPDSDNIPACQDERFICGIITLDRSEQLRIPIGGVDGWIPTVIRARMPETSVNEDNEPPPGEHDIGANGSVSDNEPKVFAISVTISVNPRTELKFWRCVSSLYCSHIARSARSRRHSRVLINDMYSRHVDPKFPSGPSGDMMLTGKFFTCHTNLERQA